jgi:hypothetical protein
MITQISLSHKYSSFKTEAAQLKNFFLKTLKVPEKCNWKNIVDEIRAFKTRGLDNLDIIHSLYKYLNLLKLIAISRDELR